MSRGWVIANRIILQRNLPGSSIQVRARQRVEDGGYNGVSFGEEVSLAAHLYAGKDSPSLLNLPAEWVDVETGLLRLDFPAIDLDPGIYLVLVLADGLPIARLEIDLEDSPGESVWRPTYITSRELTAELWQIEKKLGETPTDGAGFITYRSQARDWLDLLILQAYRPGQTSSPYSFNIPWADYSAVGPRWLADALASNALLLTTPMGRRLRLAMVYWTLSKILMRSSIQGQVAAQLDLARHYSAEADNMIMTSVAELDTDGDGVANLTINLGVTRTRRY